MNSLRDRLRSESPGLHAALERSWEVAFDEWLPAIAPNKDSFNSYPHIRNLETYLLKLVAAYDRRQENQVQLFSTLETYVLLICILLHDIGRTTTSKGHGKESKKIIEKNWAHLGIPSLGLDRSIGKICEFHDKSPRNALTAIQDLSTVVVDPYGPVRERELAAVLTLLDHMDASGLRAVADFIKQEDLYKTKPEGLLGAFRRKIRGVDVDLDGGLVKVVLGDQWNIPGDSANATFELDPTFESNDAQGEPPRWDVGKEPCCDLLERLCSEAHEDTSPPEGNAHALSARGKAIPNCGKLSDLERQLLEGKMRIGILNHQNEETEKGVAMVSSRQVDSNRLLLMMILRDTHMNQRALQPVANVLSAMGLLIRGWCVEYKEHLYNWRGDESYEPRFSSSRLAEIFEKAWQLSTQIFVSDRLSYAALAAEVAEPSVEKVRMALRRINIVGRSTPSTAGASNSGSPFWLSNDQWRWAKARGEPTTAHRDSINCFKELQMKIGRLKELLVETRT